jgi:hypothetical protein
LKSSGGATTGAPSAWMAHADIIGKAGHPPDLVKKLLEIIRRLHAQVRAYDSVLVDDLKCDPKSVQAKVNAAKKKQHIQPALDSRYDGMAKVFDAEVSRGNIVQGVEDLLERIRREIG